VPSTKVGARSARRLSLPLRGHDFERKLLLLPVLLLGCTSTPVPVAVPPPSRPAALAFTDDPQPLQRFHSRRLELYLPLPDGHAWRIDDHSRPELVATHAPTKSRVTVAVFRADSLVGRAECEALARDRKLVPSGPLQTLENALVITLENYDTRIWVAVEPGAGPDSPIVGHVMAFGGFLRKCYVFDFATSVDAAADEAVLSSRLAFARARILGGLSFEAMGTVPRETPPSPTLSQPGSGDPSRSPPP